MAEEVTVVVTDSNPPGDTVNGVYVGLYDYTTKALLQFDTTGNGALPDGTVIFSAVTAPATYEIRIVPTPPVDVVNGKIQTISVLDAPVSPLSNTFDVALTQEGLDTATNPNLCRCSGYFVDSTGVAAASVSLHFSDACLPKLEYRSGQNFDALAIVPKKKVVTTDSDGFVVLDLYRGATYSLTAEGWVNTFRTIKVPDASAANIVDVLFPVVSLVEWYDTAVQILPATAPTLALAAAADKELTITVLLRNGNEALASEVNLESSDSAVLTVSAISSDNTVTITGVAAGTANVTVSRVATDEEVAMYPVPTLVGTLAVTVS